MDLFLIFGFLMLKDIFLDLEISFLRDAKVFPFPGCQDDDSSLNPGRFSTFRVRDQTGLYQVYDFIQTRTDRIHGTGIFT